jgi:hypothetical protein
VFSFGGGFGTFVSTCLGTGRVKCCGLLIVYLLYRYLYMYHMYIQYVNVHAQINHK